MLGRGDSARSHVFQHSGALTGVRVIARWAPDVAIRAAVDAFVAVGFETRDDGLSAQLAARGSEWTATALQIGDARKSWKSGIVADLIEATPLELIPGFQRVIAPTLVVVAARESGDGTCELVAYPHTSRKGDPSAYAGAAPRVREAAAAIVAFAQATGALVSNEVMHGIKNDGSPASQRMVREILGWR